MIVGTLATCRPHLVNRAIQTMRPWCGRIDVWLDGFDQREVSIDADRVYPFDLSEDFGGFDSLRNAQLREARPHPVLMLDDDEEFIVADVERMLPYWQERALSLRIFPRFHPDDPDPVERNRNRARRYLPSDDDLFSGAVHERPDITAVPVPDNVAHILHRQDRREWPEIHAQYQRYKRMEDEG